MFKKKNEHSLVSTDLNHYFIRVFEVEYEKFTTPTSHHGGKVSSKRTC